MAVRVPGTIGLAFGAAFLAAGVPAIHFGKRRRAAYRVWREGAEFDPRERPAADEDLRPPTGVGLLVGGSLAIGAGAGLLIVGVQETNVYYADGTPVPLSASAKVAMGFGGASIVGGAVMLGFGGHLARRRRAWARRQTTAVPSPWLMPGRFGVSVAGRF